MFCIRPRHRSRCTPGECTEPYIDHPHFGSFAITPRRLAAGRREEAEDRLAFLEVIERSNLDWKEAAYAVGNILQCWEYQGTIDAILEYDEFATEATRTAVECIADLDTTSRRLTEYVIDSKESVAVVGIEQLTPLEQSILPPDYETVDPFVQEPFEMPPFRILDSPTAIVDSLLDSISASNANDIGVVLDATSEYSTLLEAALESEDIPFYGGPGFNDDPRHRALLQLLRSAHAGRDTRVRDAKPLLTRLGMPTDIDHDEKRLREVDHPGVNWILEFGTRVESMSFDDAVSEYESITGQSLDAFRDELRTLGIGDEQVTERGVDRLEFYLQSYEVPVDRENEGVLLADAKSAAHVDRPLVFYLGLDDGWTHSSPQRPWVDHDREYKRNISQFQLLLQNGVNQYYLVQDTAGGSPVTPCLYFEELLDEPFERFNDLESVHHSRLSRPTNGGFQKESVEVATWEVDAISQSSLNTYVNSPRDYYLHE